MDGSTPKIDDAPRSGEQDLAKPEQVLGFLQRNAGILIVACVVRHLSVRVAKHLVRINTQRLYVASLDYPYTSKRELTR